jgi:hypothetical protein
MVPFYGTNDCSNTKGRTYPPGRVAVFENETSGLSPLSPLQPIKDVSMGNYLTSDHYGFQ